MVEPANPFWEGYTRSQQTTSALVVALTTVLYEHPEYRLGQLLTNLARGRDLWDVYDEDWIKSLRDLSARSAEDSP